MAQIALICPRVGDELTVRVGELPGVRQEALPDVGDVSLDFRLVPGMAHAGRVGNEAPVLAVLEEAACDVWTQGVGPGHGGREVVEYQVAGDAAEEGPGRFQPFDASPSCWRIRGQAKLCRE